MNYWEIIADNLKKAGWSLGYVSALDREGRTIWIVDAHRGDGIRLVVRADEKLTAFVYLAVRWVTLFWAEPLNVSFPMIIAPPPNGGSGFIGKSGRKTANACDASASETSMDTARFMLLVKNLFGKCRVLKSDELQGRGSEQVSGEAQFERRSDLPRLRWTLGLTQARSHRNKSGVAFACY
jgi:hypothetical protein